MKKAQIAGQIFVYIIAVVVVGFIVVYGYSAIKGFSERGEEVESISLRKDLENSVQILLEKLFWKQNLLQYMALFLP